MQSHDVIVVGLGSMGSAAAYHLARRGHRVLGIDARTVPHTCGSHHGETRMIRKAYFEDPAYVPLLERAYTLWDELGDACGKRLLERTGGLYIGAPDGCIVPGSLAAARQHGLPHERLDHATLRGEFPWFAPPEDAVGFFEPDAGFLYPERAVDAHATLARHHGATIAEDTPVLSLTTDAGGVTLTTPSQTHHAAHAVVTAGAWAGQLLAGIDAHLTPTRQLLAWFRPAATDNPSFALGDGFPCWFIETDTPFGHYGFPAIDRADPLVKIALHKPGTPVDPDQLAAPHHAPAPAETDALHAVLQQHIPAAAGALADSKTCLYTNSPDGHFVIGPHPETPDLTLAAGFSGHGFKFATVVGELLADLATGTTPDLLPEHLFSPTRFSAT